jgi:hypothetical protein
MSGNFEVASFMQQLEAQRKLAQTRGQKRKSGYQENPAAKRKKLEEEKLEEEEICLCCQGPIDNTDNPGIQIFQCSHYLHEGCSQELKSNGYSQCPICQAHLPQETKNGTTEVLRQKTTAQLEQQEKDRMLASLLAAGVLRPEELAFFC